MNDNAWYKLPLSIRIAERLNATEDQKEQMEKDIEKMVSGMAIGGDAENIHVAKTKPRSGMDAGMILAWEYITRKLNPKRKW